MATHCITVSSPHNGKLAGIYKFRNLLLSCHLLKILRVLYIKNCVLGNCLKQTAPVASFGAQTMPQEVLLHLSAPMSAYQFVRFSVRDCFRIADACFHAQVPNHSRYGTTLLLSPVKHLLGSGSVQGQQTTRIDLCGKLAGHWTPIRVGIASGRTVGVTAEELSTIS